MHSSLGGVLYYAFFGGLDTAPLFTKNCIETVLDALALVS